MNLQNLQTELLVMIFCFLDSHFLISNVSSVCQRFHTIINCNYMWKSRFQFYSTKPLYMFPEVKDDEETDWKKVVYSFETENFRWKNNGFNMNKFQVRTDMVHNIRLINVRFCVSDGFRGRSLKIWNLQELMEPGNIDAADVLVIEHENAHELPIMSMATSGALLCSGGADAMIHLWELGNSSFQRVNSTKCQSYVFCLSMHGSVVAAGTDKFVSIFDVRIGFTSIFNMPVHIRAVTDVYIDENYLISSGTDGKISFYDRRANKVFTECRCPNSSKYVNRISCGDGFFFGGDSQGAIHVWDMTATDFQFIHTFPIDHEQFVTGLGHTMGCVVSGSADGKLNVFSVTHPCVPWMSCEERYVTDLHYMHKVLVSVTNSDLITIWKPKSPNI